MLNLLTKAADRCRRLTSRLVVRLVLAFTSVSPVLATTSGLTFTGTIDAEVYFDVKPYSVRLELEAYHFDNDLLMSLANPEVQLVIFGSGNSITYWSKGRMRDFEALDDAVRKKRGDRILGALFPTAAVSLSKSVRTDDKLWTFASRTEGNTSWTEVFRADDRELSPHCLEVQAALYFQDNNLMQFELIN